MFYEIRAWNSQSLYVWASDETDVIKYVDWLNRNRDINVYSHYEIAEADVTDDIINEAMSCDEPCWDDFMAEV